MPAALDRIFQNALVVCFGCVVPSAATNLANLPNGDESFVECLGWVIALARGWWGAAVSASADWRRAALFVGVGLDIYFWVGLG